MRLCKIREEKGREENSDNLTKEKDRIKWNRIDYIVAYSYMTSKDESKVVLSRSLI